MLWSFVEEGRGLSIRRTGGVVRVRVDTELLSFPATEAKEKEREREREKKKGKEKEKSLNRPKQEKFESAEKEGMNWRCYGN